MFFVVSQVFSFRLKKQTSKNVVDTTFKRNPQTSKFKTRNVYLCIYFSNICSGNLVIRNISGNFST